jgi:hypothetical protein
MTHAPTESCSPPNDRARNLRRNSPLIVWALALIAIHICLVGYFEPFEWLSSSIPITGVDFDTHAEQTFRVLEGLQGWGESWVYDVRLQAGFPNGTIFDADNKLWELWTYCFVGLGATPAVAYNSFVFLAHLLIVPWIYASARAFRLTPARALLAATLASALWLFDSYAHWFWWIGTVAYIFAAYFYLLPLALFYRFCGDGKLWRLVIVTVLLALAHLLHPYSFFVLAFPMLVLYLRALPKFRWTHHCAVGVMIVAVVAANAYWLLVAIKHWHYVLNSAFFGQSHPGFVLADFFSVVIDPSTTGYLGTRAAFRWLAFVAAFGMLRLWRRERDERFVLFASALVCMLVLAYVAPIVIAPIRQIQPYRFVASAFFLAVFPAAELFHRLWEQRAALITVPLAGAAAALAVALGAQHLATDVLYFMPDLLPVLPDVREAPFALTGTGFGPHLRYRHPLPKAIDLTLDRWIDQHADEGRIAVTDWTGERFAWSTRAQILGGFVDLNLTHAHAHPVRWVDHGIPTAAQLRQYIETYAVKYFVVRFGDFGLPALPELVSFHASFGAAQVYRAHAPASYLFSGSGHVSASTNRIAVAGTAPEQPVELKYHWHEALVCKPACRVERVRTDLDPVGFIRVPAPHPSSFTIENSYRF